MNEETLIEKMERVGTALADALIPWLFISFGIICILMLVALVIAMLISIGHIKAVGV